MRILFLLLSSVVLLRCGDGANFSPVSAFEYDGDWQREQLDVDNRVTDQLDILVVIDKSASMKEVRDNLSDKLDALLASVGDRDWKIAIITTDPKDCLRGLVTPDNKGDFAKTINEISGGSNYEEAIGAAINGLRGMPLRKIDGCGEETVSWRRKDSALAIIIVTDEDLQCSELIKGYECSVQDLLNLLDVMDYVLHLNARIYGFLNKNKQRKFMEMKDKDGETIFSHTAAHDGTEDDYKKVLREISGGLGNIYQSKFLLKKEHDGHEARVTIVLADGTTQELEETDYGFVGKELIIISRISSDAQHIVVDYSYGN